MGEVGVWAVGARLIHDRTENLAQRTDGARQGYESAIEQAKQVVA
ncbi:hypothetical protein ON058_02875 [Demequina sp. B12]|nr:hypothetical protein [Demequina sp. B12]MDE0572354.1 hypothetical protein [Demequina sp. B12]